MPIFKAPNNDTCRVDIPPSGDWVEISEAEYLSICASREVPKSQPTLQERIDAECQKYGIANEVTLDGLMGGMLALGMLSGKTAEQLAEENAAFKIGMTLRAQFAQWRAT